METINEYIQKSANKLNVDKNVAEKATALYMKAMNHPAIVDTRIKDTNIGLACLYIANRLYSVHPLDQNIFVYKFPISFATLRKCYIRICDALKIPRQRIVSPHHLKKPKRKPVPKKTPKKR